MKKLFSYIKMTELVDKVDPNPNGLENLKVEEADCEKLIVMEIIAVDQLRIHQDEITPLEYCCNSLVRLKKDDSHI